VVITVFASLYFLVVAGYIASTDDITEGDVLIAGLTVNLNGTAYSDDNVWHGVLAYHLFGWLWTVQMIDAVTYLIIAGAASEWYFSLDKSDLSFAPVCAATYRTFRYHLGTAAFGSMLIAMVDFVRGMVEYVVGKSKGLEKQSAVAKAMMCIVRCCLWCLKKCLRFISENAFIMTAAQGTSFYTSMKKAFSLITNNFARIATVATMSWFVLFLGRVLVTSVCCLIVIIIVYEDPAAQIKGLNNLDFNDVSSPILPAVRTSHGVLADRCCVCCCLLKCPVKPIASATLYCVCPRALPPHCAPKILPPPMYKFFFGEGPALFIPNSFLVFLSCVIRPR
jgi:choline transporter-like protein 2/4/5